MIILTSETDNLKIALGGAVATNQLKCITNYQVNSGNSISLERSVVTTNNTTDVNLIPSPQEGEKLILDSMLIQNIDTSSVVIEIKLEIEGYEFVLYEGSIGAGAYLVYEKDSGFVGLSLSGVVGSVQSVSISSNVVNNNAVANTMQDVTGLGFDVLAGKTYWFKFIIPYSVAVATTGSRWGVKSTTGTADGLTMFSEYSLTSTTTTKNENVQAFDSPASCNASSASLANNLCIMEGKITPTADGFFGARFASEVSGSAVTALAGSICHYQQLTN